MDNRKKSFEMRIFLRAFYDHFFSASKLELGIVANNNNKKKSYVHIFKAERTQIKKSISFFCSLDFFFCIYCVFVCNIDIWITRVLRARHIYRARDEVFQSFYIFINYFCVFFCFLSVSFRILVWVSFILIFFFLLSTMMMPFAKFNIYLGGLTRLQQQT